jgi:hypothetical protein
MNNPSYMNIFLSTWSLLAGGLIFALPMIYLRVRDHTELEEETLYVFTLLSIFSGAFKLIKKFPPSRARMDDDGNLRDVNMAVEHWRHSIR